MPVPFTILGRSGSVHFLVVEWQLRKTFVCAVFFESRVTTYILKYVSKV